MMKCNSARLRTEPSDRATRIFDGEHGTGCGSGSGSSIGSRLSLPSVYCTGKTATRGMHGWHKQKSSGKAARSTGGVAAAVEGVESWGRAGMELGQSQSRAARSRHLSRCPYVHVGRPQASRRRVGESCCSEWTPRTVKNLPPNTKSVSQSV